MIASGRMDCQNRLCTNIGNKGRNMDIVIEKERLPESVHGLTCKHNEDYHVIINEESDANRQLVSLIHEVCHIWRGDLESESSAEEIERSCRESMLRVALQILEEE